VAIHPAGPSIARFAAIVALAGLAWSVRPPAAHADDAAAGFVPTANPASPWSYGWTPTLAGAFTLLATHGTDANGLDNWRDATNLTQVTHNGTPGGKTVGNAYTPAGGLDLQPGNGGQYVVARWTASQDGSYTVHARLASRMLPTMFMSAEVAVLLDGAVAYDRYVSATGQERGDVNGTFALTAGQTIDFVVGDAHDGLGPDLVGLDATVDEELPEPASGAAYTFGGERFAGCRWGSAFESIAFDPVDQHLYAADGSVSPKRLLRIDRDTRAATVVGDLGAPVTGMSWDPVTSKFLAISNTGVYRVDPATAATTLLTATNGAGFEGLAVVPVPAAGTVLSAEAPPAPASVRLAAFPNPSRGGATVAFTVPAAGDARVGVYDVAGRLVRELRSGRATAGTYRLEWDGRDAAGAAVASGVFFLRLESAGRTTVARLAVVR